MNNMINMFMPLQFYGHFQSANPLVSYSCESSLASAPEIAESVLLYFSIKGQIKGLDEMCHMWL